MKKKTILWIEDREETISDQIEYCYNNGYIVEIVRTERELFNYLEDSSDNVDLIILDVMLYSVQNFDNIGIYDVDTAGGYDAGWALLEHILRSEEYPAYHKIPILILTSRTKEEEKFNKFINKQNKFEDAAKIYFIEKSGGLEKDGRNWEEKFINTIDQVLERVQL